MRYNFHEIKESLKQDPSKKLPDDINSQVIDHFNKIGCPIAEGLIKEFEKHIRYGSIEFIHSDVPAAKISMQIDCGMVDSYKMCELYQDGKWTAIVKYSIRNKKLDKTKGHKHG